MTMGNMALCREILGELCLWRSSLLPLPPCRCGETMRCSVNSWVLRLPLSYTYARWLYTHFFLLSRCACACFASYWSFLQLSICLSSCRLDSNCLPCCVITRKTPRLVPMCCKFIETFFHRLFRLPESTVYMYIFMISPRAANARRCLTQQWSVRAMLYNGLDDVVAQNPALHSDVLTLLEDHVSFSVSCLASACLRCVAGTEPYK